MAEKIRVRGCPEAARKIGIEGVRDLSPGWPASGAGTQMIPPSPSEALHGGSAGVHPRNTSEWPPPRAAKLFSTARAF